MMAPKLRFSRGLKAKAPGAVTACVPGPLRRRSSKFLQACRSRLSQETTMGKVTIFFFYLRGSFKCMIVILPTFWHSAPAWDFSWQLTRNVSLGTMLVHSYRRSLDEGYGQASVHCELKRRRLRSQQTCDHFPPGAPVTSFLSQQISTVIRSPRFQQDDTGTPAELSPRSPSKRKPSNVQLVPACRIWEQPQRCFPPFGQKPREA